MSPKATNVASKKKGCTFSGTSLEDKSTKRIKQVRRAKEKDHKDNEVGKLARQCKGIVAVKLVKKDIAKSSLI